MIQQLTESPMRAYTMNIKSNWLLKYPILDSSKYRHVAILNHSVLFFPQSFQSNAGLSCLQQTSELVVQEQNTCWHHWTLKCQLWLERDSIYVVMLTETIVTKDRDKIESNQRLIGSVTSVTNFVVLLVCLSLEQNHDLFNEILSFYQFVVFQLKHHCSHIVDQTFHVQSDFQHCLLHKVNCNSDWKIKHLCREIRTPKLKKGLLSLIPAGKHIQSGIACYIYPHCVLHPLLPGQLKSQRGGNSSVSRLLSLGCNQDWKKKHERQTNLVVSCGWTKNRLQSFSCAYILCIPCSHHTSFVVMLFLGTWTSMVVQMEKTWPDLEVFISAWLINPTPAGMVLVKGSVKLA